MKPVMDAAKALRERIQALEAAELQARATAAKAFVDEENADFVIRSFAEMWSSFVVRTQEKSQGYDALLAAASASIDACFARGDFLSPDIEKARESAHKIQSEKAAMELKNKEIEIGMLKALFVSPRTCLQTGRLWCDSFGD